MIVDRCHDGGQREATLGRSAAPSTQFGARLTAAERSDDQKNELN